MKSMNKKNCRRNSYSYQTYEDIEAKVFIRLI